ncbi:VOC family protein [Macrococcus lamae]|uniref:Ring-cleaving dioxygenase n=1 Tax=Macrococcus lamae TaxID=198484 RepID=A0A4R6BY04_9STAP|nr:VOC family protein [Macrococcus lamae]TDM13267.1 ring-cleaving dioxygenase [Macrococcus lamae]
MNLSGIHHVTVKTTDMQKCYDFYHHILGMKLVKRTVSIDDTSAHHLYFGDGTGSPGTQLSFMATHASDYRQGTNDVFAYSLRVPTDQSLYYFKLRFDEFNVNYDSVIQLNGRHALPFYDMDDRLVYLVSDENNTGVKYGTADIKSTVDSIHQIVGLGPILLSVVHTLSTASVLNQVLNFDRTGEYSHVKSAQPVQVYSIAEGGNGGELHLMQSDGLTGQSNVHHIALRADGENKINQLLTVLETGNIPNSGEIDQFYCKSLYFKDLSGVLFEIATDLPGLTVDESEENLGSTLSLPPSLNNERTAIEDNLTPINLEV